MALRLALLLGAAAGAAATSRALLDDNVTYPTLGAYTAVSEVTPHSMISLDSGECEGFLKAYEWESAYEIYMNGKNSVKGSGLRTLASMAMKTSLVDVPLFQGFQAVYGAAVGEDSFLHTYMVAAMNGTGIFEGKSDVIRSVAAQKNLIAILVIYSDYEGFKALGKANEGVPAGPSNKYWDEYWAFHYGVDGKEVPYEVMGKRDADFGTASQAMATAAFLDGQVKAVAADVEGLEASIDAIHKELTVTFVQAALKYGYKVQKAITDGTTVSDKDWAEGYTYWRVIAGAFGHDAVEAAQTIDAAYTINQDVSALSPTLYCTIRDQVACNMPGGLTLADLGELSSDHGKGIIIPADACPAPAPECPPMLGPYQALSPVTQHAQIAMDSGEVMGFLKESPPNFEAAYGIYANGKNSAKGSGMRTLHSMATKSALADVMSYQGAMLLYSPGGDTSYQAEYMVSALNGTGIFAGKSDTIRSVAAQKNLISILSFYADYEAEKALDKANDGIPASYTNKYWDEYWAFHYGTKGKYTPYEVMGKRDADFGTASQADSTAHFIAGQAAAAAATPNVDGMENAIAHIQKYITITFMQAALKYGYKVQAAVAEGNLPGDKDWSEGYTYWRVSAGAIAATNLTAATAIETAYHLDQEASEVSAHLYCIIRDNLACSMPGGLTLADLGELSSDHGKGIIIPADACPSGVPTCAAPAEEEPDHTDDHAHTPPAAEETSAAAATAASAGAAAVLAAALALAL